MSNNNIIIYTGYYHACNINYILKTYYEYEEMYSIGNVNDIENTDENDITNCLFINKNIFNN